MDHEPNGRRRKKFLKKNAKEKFSEDSKALKDYGVWKSENQAKDTNSLDG